MPNVFHSFSSLLSGLLIFMTRWAMMLNGTLPSAMVSHNYTPTHQRRVVRTSYHCRASWGLKNSSPGTYRPTASLPFLMGDRRISLLQCTMPADIGHAEIRWQFDHGAIPTICFFVLGSLHATWARRSAPICSRKTTGKNQPMPEPFAFWGVMKWPVPEDGQNVTRHPHSDKD